jgi:alpha-L-fucosidase
MCLARPYESVTVRGVPIKRVERVVEMASGTELAFTTRCAVLDSLLNSDPHGELRIEVPAHLVDDHATVLALDITPA